MKSNLISVPFKAGSESGLWEYNGLAKFSRAGIIIEFNSKIVGLEGGDVKEVRIPINEILDIKFKKGFYKFFPRIHLRSKNYETLAALPNKGGKVKLSIKREDFELAKEAVAQTTRIINSDTIPEIESDAPDGGQLPSAQTSVNELFDTKKFETPRTNEIGEHEDGSS